MQVNEDENSDDSDDISYAKHDNTQTDKTYVNTEEEIGVKRPMKFKDAIKIADRFNLSDRCATLFINSILEDVNMDHLLLSKSQFGKWKAQIREESKEKYDQENQGITCIKFDGGTEKVLTGHNQTEPRHLLTMMKEGFNEPNPRYLNHEESGKTGVEMAGIVFQELVATDSLETLQAAGCGE